MVLSNGKSASCCQNNGKLLYLVHSWNYEFQCLLPGLLWVPHLMFVACSHIPLLSSMTHISIYRELGNTLWQLFGICEYPSCGCFFEPSPIRRTFLLLLASNDSRTALTNPYPEPVLIKWQSSGNPVCLEFRPQCTLICHWSRNCW